MGACKCSLAFSASSAEHTALSGSACASRRSYGQESGFWIDVMEEQAMVGTLPACYMYDK